MALASATMLAGRYRVLRPIGAGGMGEVYEAEQVSLGRRVALKVLFDNEEKALARFEHEARAMARLAHPHVVSIIDFHGDADPPLFVMEMLEGASLDAVLKREGPFAPARAIRIALQMLDGLAAAHRAGIVHRDIKPSNVFLVRDARGLDMVKLLDFGVAKAAGGPKTTAGVVVGTPAYLAPEQMLGEEVDGRVDLRAVALCLYVMLSGKRPWRSAGSYELGAEIVRDEPLTFAELGVAIDPNLAAVVQRAASRDRSARYPDAPSMHAALAALAPSASTQQLPLAVLPAPVREPTAPTQLVDVPARLPAAPPTPRSAPTAPMALPIPPAQAPSAAPAPIPTAAFLALGAVALVGVGAVVVYEWRVSAEPSATATATDASAPISSAKAGPFTSVPQMISAHAYGETVDGAGCTCYPLEVMSEPWRAPLECPTCTNQRVRGSGRCVGDDKAGRRLNGVYLCREILGPKP